MIFKINELRNLWPFYLCNFIYGLSMMIFPFLILYFINLGFSYFQISIISAAFGFSTFLFEIPTGAFADSFSRKYSVILGSLIIAGAVTFIPFTSNYYFLVILWALAGMGITFISGAEEAWIIDNLNKEERPDLHQEYFIKHKSFSALGAIFAPILGALLVKYYSLKVLWFVYGFGVFLNAILIFLFTEEHFVKKKLSFLDLLKRSYYNSKIAFRFSYKNKTILFSILAGLFMQLMFVGGIGMQPFLVSLGMAEYQLGYLFSFSAAAGIGMSFLSRHFVKFNPNNVMSIVIIIKMIFLFSLLFIHPPFFYVAGIIFIIGDGLIYFGTPIFQPYFHGFIPKKIRATVLSTKSMLSQFVMALSCLVSGVFLDLFGPQKVIAFGSLFGIISIILYRKIKN